MSDVIKAAIEASREHGRIGTPTEQLFYSQEWEPRFREALAVAVPALRRCSCIGAIGDEVELTCSNCKALTHIAAILEGKP